MHPPEKGSEAVQGAPETTETQWSMSGPAKNVDEGKDNRLVDATMGKPHALASSATIGCPS